MAQVRQTVMLYARSPATVLIEGETGTGKELAAQAIHRESALARAGAKPFVAVNCGAIAESLLESELFGHEEGAFTGSRRGGRAGLIEAAHRGTLFLDEIGEMPLALQTRLLRVLEEREVMRVGGTRPVPVDVRVISATHCDLAALVAQGRFRADLYYRLSVLRLRLPPLRERQEDVPALAEWLLKHALAAMNVRPHANLHAEITACAPLLCRHDWPGNVRELRNLMQRLALFLSAEPLQALTPGFLLRHAPELAALDGASDAAIAPETPEASAETVTEALRRCGGNRAEAAKRLGISRTTLWRRLREEAGIS
jgi:propionate catabolism operon transcriptional regulator